MSETKKAVLVVMLSVACLAALCTWLLPRQVTTTVWTLRGALSLAVLVNLGLVIWAFRRRDRAPDFLRHLPGPIFERTGVCFAVAPSVSEGIAYLVIAFQNRFSSPGDFRVVLTPPSGLLQSSQSKIEGIDVVMECPGGALGIIRTPIGLPAGHQGKKIKLQVTAQTQYFSKGTMLRVRSGRDVVEADKSQLQAAIITGVALLFGHVHFFVHRTPRIKIAFAGPVAETIPGELEPTVETLWLPGEPADGVAERLKQAMCRKAID